MTIEGCLNSRERVGKRERKKEIERKSEALGNTLNIQKRAGRSVDVVTTGYSRDFPDPAGKLTSILHSHILIGPGGRSDTWSSEVSYHPKSRTKKKTQLGSLFCFLLAL